MRRAHLLVLGLLVGAPNVAHAYDARHLFITNRGGSNVLELDEDLTLVRSWFDAEGLSVPNGMAFTPDGAIWVADTGNDRILAFDGAGVVAGTIDTSVRLGVSVESMYFAGDGTLFATANPGRGVVARYGIDRSVLPDLVAEPLFENLGNVNLTVDGNVLVSDFSGMGRGLRELDPATGALLATFGTDLGRQEDVMVDGGDRVFVSHYDADEVVVFGPDRAELYRFTAPPGGPALEQPTGIALTHDCRIFVVSFANGTLFEFRHEGARPPSFVRAVAVPGLSQAESLAIAGLALPGGFEEFVDGVPSCDEPSVPDVGTTADAGGRDAGAEDGGSALDADAPDAGRRGPSAGACGCRVARADHGPWPLFALFALLARAARRRRPR
jgi:MYXO-CTERM domain-containing protein